MKTTLMGTNLLAFPVYAYVCVMYCVHIHTYIQTNIPLDEQRLARNISFCDVRRHACIHTYMRGHTCIHTYMRGHTCIHTYMKTRINEYNLYTHINVSLIRGSMCVNLLVKFFCFLLVLVFINRRTNTCFY
jgi:hypothetical protein